MIEFSKKTTTKTLRTLIQWQPQGKRVSIHQGGSRSGKTWGILMYIVYWCWIQRGKGKTVLICRHDRTTHEDTTWADFMEIIANFGLYDDKNCNKTRKKYKLFGNTVKFIGLNDAQKLRGLKSNLIYFNEANEISWKAFSAAILRCTGRVIIDFNPSEEFWLDRCRKKYEGNIEPIHKTTFRDNPFLAKEVIDEILALKNDSERDWKIFGEGEFVKKEGLIYQNWRRVFTPFPKIVKRKGYGMDFGFVNDPTAALRGAIVNGKLHLQEILYKKRLSSSDIASELKLNGVLNSDEFVADNDNRLIAEINSIAGLSIFATEKFNGSVKAGIREMQKYEIIVHDSPNLIKEFNLYEWKVRNGEPIDEPIDKHNHLCDAARYFVYDILRGGKVGNVAKQKL